MLSSVVLDFLVVVGFLVVLGRVVDAFFGGSDCTAEGFVVTGSAVVPAAEITGTVVRFWVVVVVVEVVVVVVVCVSVVVCVVVSSGGAVVGSV